MSDVTNAQNDGAGAGEPSGPPVSSGSAPNVASESEQLASEPAHVSSEVAQAHVSSEAAQAHVSSEAAQAHVSSEAAPSQEPPQEVPTSAEELEVHEVARHFSAPALLPLSRLSDDDTFRIRDSADEEVAELATDIARLGQLFPIDVRLVAPDQLQVITGFRRVAALRFLRREKVVARLHTDLSDADATLMALASAIHSRTVEPESLLAAQERLDARGLLAPAARDMLVKAFASDEELAPENVEEEVDADELAEDVTVRLSQCNQDLSLLADVFDQLDTETRDALMAQLRYSIDLVGFLESKK